ncbi:hypothetical protein [Weissella confusa]|uniref:hypothetical protein n=1 Tax=Weissella confusa TaxID=1583 RepID=UPI00107FE7FC|nr:hypothetical protein [Weissella confusa]TGE55824.1 hypothetical protein C6P21_11295 [Weissella confusa]TGE56337.1 hypothetical protein C6P19_10910 [Weissella confusa]
MKNKNKSAFWIPFSITFCFFLFFLFAEPFLDKIFGTHTFLYRVILLLIVSLLSGAVANYISYRYNKRHK